MRVQEILGKDVHNMKALSAKPKLNQKLSRSGQANPGFEGGRGVQGVQAKRVAWCWGHSGPKNVKNTKS